jgi:hypothetical protein
MGESAQPIRRQLYRGRQHTLTNSTPATHTARQAHHGELNAKRGQWDNQKGRPTTKVKPATNSENIPKARTCAVLTLKSDAGSQQDLIKRNLSDEMNNYIRVYYALNVVATY